MNYAYRAATMDDLERIWEKNIADNAGNDGWKTWRDVYIKDNEEDKCKTFVFLCDGKPMGEGTLLFSPECKAVAGRTALADGMSTVNVNALRVDKAHEGEGHISELVRIMEKYAADQNYQTVTIGVEAKETRNLAIYLHWGYNNFVMSEVEDSALVLYYSKSL